jgi:hypothetical protein
MRAHSLLITDAARALQEVMEAACEQLAGDAAVAGQKTVRRVAGDFALEPSSNLTCHTGSTYIATSIAQSVQRLAARIQARSSTTRSKVFPFVNTCHSQEFQGGSYLGIQSPPAQRRWQVKRALLELLVHAPGRMHAVARSSGREQHPADKRNPLADGVFRTRAGAPGCFGCAIKLR